MISQPNDWRTMIFKLASMISVTPLIRRAIWTTKVAIRKLLPYSVNMTNRRHAFVWPV